MDNVNGMTQALKNFQSGMGMMKTEARDTMTAFNGFMDKVLEDDVLDKKTKELIALGMAITARCKYCIGIHVQKVLQAGGTRAEIVDVCKVAILMGGGPAMTYIAEVHNALEAFDK